MDVNHRKGGARSSGLGEQRNPRRALLRRGIDHWNARVNIDPRFLVIGSVRKKGERRGQGGKKENTSHR